MRLQIRNKDHKYPFDLISGCPNDGAHTMEFNAEFFCRTVQTQVDTQT